MEQRNKKRIVISFIYVVIFSLVLYGGYSLFRPEETCFDGKKNQNEENVDCGGVCAKCKKIEASSLIVGEKGFLESGVAGEYDFFAEVVNPNGTYGSDKFTYQLTLKDTSGNVVAEKNGVSFVLPGERKYIVGNNLKSSGIPVQAEFLITDPSWKEFADYYERPDLKIVNKTYNQITSGVGFSEAKGLLKNDSPFDFAEINVKVLLKDQSGKIVALNSTQMRTVRAAEERDFRVFWPSRFGGEVMSVETQAEVNIFDSLTFLKRYAK